ncbi:DedA family protein [Actinacidiphila acididurans]|uniref:DedA family protein n=1 Tax=Actinacidiphila acididurans TaxID=2784346 RepID=A0ABS2TQX7_9ACTN|nr:DedA family protein [Actinacidiphila acididurans]MBM9505237.1 DedA family protein [Actinacidiphila acididurans]
MPLPALNQAVNVLDATSLLSSFGALGIAVVMFAETGLLIGFFLPGDSLLFTAGLFCVNGSSKAVHLSLWQVLIAAAAGALLGAQTGYVIGKRGGPALLARSRSRKLHEGAARAEELLGRYGHAKAVVLARFIPVVRTVLNPLAGALGVPARTFTLWQVIGGAVWSLGLVLGGYALGSSIPHVDNYLLPLVALIVILSLIPLVLEMRRGRGRGGDGGGSGRGEYGGPGTYGESGGENPRQGGGRHAAQRSAADSDRY